MKPALNILHIILTFHICIAKVAKVLFYTEYYWPIYLPFLVEYQFGILAVRFISANQNKIHICQNAETAISTEYRLELISEIGGVVVKEFCADTARQMIQIQIISGVYM